MAFATHAAAEAAITALQANAATVVAEAHADTTIVNTTTETDAVSLTLPTTLAAGDLVRLTVWADQLNNSGSTVNYTYRLKCGATTVLATAALGLATGANRLRMPFTFEGLIVSTTAQRWRGLASGAVRGTDSFNAIANTAPAIFLTGYGTSAEDTTSAKTVKLTVQMGTASASTDFVCHGATLEIVKKV